jgi:hypothetical protein
MRIVTERSVAVPGIEAPVTDEDDRSGRSYRQGVVGGPDPPGSGDHDGPTGGRWGERQLDDRKTRRRA